MSDGRVSAPDRVWKLEALLIGDLLSSWLALASLKAKAVVDFKTRMATLDLSGGKSHKACVFVVPAARRLLKFCD